MNLGIRLKKAREHKKLTQMDVAKKLGISNGTLSGYERNYRDPDTDTLKKLANLYGVSLDWLKGNEQREEEIIEGVKEFDEDTSNLSIEDLFNKYTLTLDGREFTEQEFKNFVAFLRAHRSLGQDV